MDFYYRKIIRFSIYNFYIYDFAALYSFIAIYKNIKIPTILKLNEFVHQIALPVKNIGIAIKIPIIASPVINPEANNIPFSFEVLFTLYDIILPINIGTDKLIGK